MQSKSNSQDSKSGTDGSIIDASGKPLKRKVMLRDRWKQISSKMKITVISITAFVALLATFLTNLEKLGNYLESDEAAASIPNIVVKLSNSSERDVIVAARGDFMLWLPGPDAYHTMGKYEFLTIEEKSPSEGSFTIPPDNTITLLAKIMNKNLYSRILSQADCDLSLLVYRAGGGLTHTNNMPFTSDAIEKYYIEADVGRL